MIHQFKKQILVVFGNSPLFDNYSCSDSFTNKDFRKIIEWKIDTQRPGFLSGEFIGIVMKYNAIGSQTEIGSNKHIITEEAIICQLSRRIDI